MVLSKTLSSPVYPIIKETAMSIAACILIGALVLCMVRIFIRHDRPDTDNCITNGRFERLKAHEQESITRGRVFWSP
jgi:hypothetical protein